ncbi:MAG: hypothetical protein O8C59_05530, partial [Candidatus Methanoperedens sp.]|nr:hypothetical protein [Candidatus Methanoperedens sp.]
MNNHKKIFLVIWVSLVSTILLAANASADAPPPIPNTFSGAIRFENSSGQFDAPAGTVIDAYIDNVMKGNSIVNTAGRYSIDVDGSYEDDGKNIYFKINNLIADQISVFNANNAPPRMLDLISVIFKQIQSSTGNGTVNFDVNIGVIEDLVAVNLSDIPESPPEGVNLYYGLFRFNVTGLLPGSSATMILVFPDNLPPSTIYWKYGATTTNISPHWYTIPSTINGKSLTIMLTDGGQGDDDLTVNGLIKDDGGPSIDITKPVINSVTLNTTSVNTGDPILVTVNASDNIGVTEVKAN